MRIKEACMSWIEMADQYFLPVFKRLPVEVDRGEGVYLIDRSGKRYLDFLSGIGVNALGYSHPAVLQAMEKQMHRNLHLSNYFVQDVQIELAERLIRYSGMARLFFTNSGTEAVEGALKIVKKWANQHGKSEIICFEGAFHGRTIGALSVTAQEKYQKSFQPLLPGIQHIPYNNVEKLRESVTEKTAAVVLEFVQGEGGVVPATPEFVAELASLREKFHFLIIADEIQAGIGRTGYFFSYEHYGIRPDIVTSAKALGGGMPLGAFLVSEPLVNVLVRGEHGTTFGGNPVSCAAGIAVVDELMENGLLDHVKEVGEYFSAQLRELQKKYPEKIKEVRGRGLMQAMVINEEGYPYVLKGIENGLVFNATATNVLRFLPPLIVTKAEIDTAVEVLSTVLK
ncbi:MAG TPA: aspartate aminotransferase family protein [Calditrichae bacterium]|nr:aspartate aminotransferase family protein [Calditrichia bacterium]